MASERRIQRLGSTLRKEISEAIMMEVKDPRMLSMVSVLEVELSKNMKYVKVTISIYGESEKDNLKTLDALNHASGYISSIVSKNLHMRYAPEIKFVRTDSLEKSMEIHQQLKELSNENQQDDRN